MTQLAVEEERSGPPRLTAVEDSVAAESPEHLRKRYEAVVARLRAYKDSSGKTYAQLASEIGPQPNTNDLWAANTVNTFLSGNYPVDHAGNLIVAAERLIARIEARQKLIVQTSFVKTSVAKALLTLIKRCELFVRIGIAAMEPGVGKTEGLKFFARENPTSIFIRANATFSPRSSRSAYPTLRKLATELDVDAQRIHDQSLLYDNVVRRLAGTSRVLVFDQAHFLPPEALEVLMTINEDANVPVILAGHTATLSRGPEDWENLVAYRSRSLPLKLTTRDIKPADVDLIAEQVLDVSVAKDARSRLLEEARSSGGFRRLMSILQVAQTLTDGGAVKLAHVLKAIEEVPQFAFGGEA